MMGRGASVAVMPAAAFAVHQLRFLLAFGGHAGLVLERQGHAYLQSLAPWVMLLVAAAGGVFLRALGSALKGEYSAPRYAASFAALWLACAGSLLAIYASQEFLEGLFATGHPAGLIGIFGYGGWWSIPAALAVGLVVAAGFHSARWILREITELSLRNVARPARRTNGAPRPGDVLLPRLAPLAGGWSGRGPPC